MVSKSGPIRTRLRRLVVACGVIVAAMAAAPAVASALPPTSFTFDNTSSDVDHTTCAADGFDVAYILHEYGFGRTFFAADGAVTGTLVQVNQDVTLSANGKTIFERDRYTLFINPDGSTRTVGLPTHIQGPGGVVLLDAGRLIQAPDGTVLVADGPHPQLFGANFCAALAP